MYIEYAFFRWLLNFYFLMFNEYYIIIVQCKILEYIKSCSAIYSPNHQQLPPNNLDKKLA